MKCDHVHWILFIVYMDLLGLSNLSTRFYAKCTWILCVTCIGFCTLTIFVGFCALYSWALCIGI